MDNRCRVIGVLDDGVAGVSSNVLETIRQADIVIGGTRVLRLFADVITGEICDLTGHLTSVPEWIDEGLAAGKKVVVLATGDPMRNGIGGYLVDKLGADRLAIFPAPSTLQIAFARFGMAWDRATLASVHAKESGEWKPGDGPDHGMTPLVNELGAPLIGLLTRPENDPARIARTLIAAGWGEAYTMRIAERLHQADERLTGPIPPSQAAAMTYADPNVVILEQVGEGDATPLFGLPDESYTRRSPKKGLITRREVRAVSLAMMGLRPDSIVWDIGAGSGSLGLEAARLAPRGHVYAVEKNEADFTIALANREALRVSNYTLLNAKAPERLDTFPDPDAIFIGGSGGELSALIERAMTRLKRGGRLVMNFVTIENLTIAIETLKRESAVWEMTQINVARSEPILSMNRLQAENPVWIVTASKESPCL